MLIFWDGGSTIYLLSTSTSVVVNTRDKMFNTRDDVKRWRNKSPKRSDWRNRGWVPNLFSADSDDPTR